LRRPRSTGFLLSPAELRTNVDVASCRYVLQHLLDKSCLFSTALAIYQQTFKHTSTNKRCTLQFRSEHVFVRKRLPRNLETQTKTLFYNVKWSCWKSSGICFTNGSKNSNISKVRDPRRYPQPLCRSSCVHFRAQNRQGHGRP
jgi:hypothetical protein